MPARSPALPCAENPDDLESRETGHGMIALPPDAQQTIERRARMIDVLKADLIRRLNLPYAREDLHEDVALLGSGLGLDSLDALEIVLCAEGCFDIKFPDGEVAALRSINTIIDFSIDGHQDGFSSEL